MEDRRETQDRDQDQGQVPEKIARMGKAPVGSLMLEFAIPALVAIVFNALYNIIDTVFLGQAVGKIGLAATTVAAPIMTLNMALGVLPGQGGNSLAAILLGKGRHKDAERTLGNAVTVLIVIWLAMCVFATFFLDIPLRLIGATDETLPASRTFVQIVLYGSIASHISFGISNFIRTAGAPNLALAVSVIATVICIALNYLFVMVWGWGVAGSAWATVLGQASGAAVVLWYFCSRKSHAPFKLRAKNLAIDPVICKRLLVLGLAPFALQIASTVSQTVGNMVLAYWGALSPIGTDGAMASIGVVMKITMFTVFPTIGIAMAAQPILGFNTGARLYERVLKTFYVALAAGTGLLVIFFALIHIFPEQIVGLFGVESDLMDFSIYALKVQTILIPFVAIQIIGSNYFQATGQPIKSMILSLTRQVIFNIPLFLITPQAIPALFPQVSNLMGYCYSFPIADFMSIVMCGCFVIAEIRRLKRLIAEEHVDQ